MRIEVAAPYRGILRNVIKRMKYDGEIGWTPLLGRLLARRLEAAFDPSEVDLILPNPIHPSRPVRHTELVLEACAVAAARPWRFDGPLEPCLLKTDPTPKSHRRTPPDAPRRLQHCPPASLSPGPNSSTAGGWSSSPPDNSSGWSDGRSSTTAPRAWPVWRPLRPRYPRSPAVPPRCSTV